MKCIASVLKGYFVCASCTMNTNGGSHLHMRLMKMYLCIYDNLIGMPKKRPPKPRTYRWYLPALTSYRHLRHVVSILALFAKDLFVISLFSIVCVLFIVST